MRYTCGDVEVADTLREVRDGEATALRRVLSAKGTASLVLRLARHQDIRQTSDNTAVVAGWMQVRSYAQPLILVTDGDQRELRVALATSAQGEVSQQIDYSRVEGK